MLGLPVGAPAQVLLVGRLGEGVLGFEFLAAATQTRNPRPTISQLGRQLVAAAGAEPLVFGGVDRDGLAEDPVNLFTNRCVRARRRARGVPRDQRPLDGDQPNRHQAGPRAEPENPRECLGQRVLMTGPKPPDRGRDPECG